MIRRSVLRSQICVLLLSAVVQPARAQSLTTVRVALGLDDPVAIAAAPADPTRLFVAEQTGAIRIIDLTADPPTLLATVFLDIDPLVHSGGEQGLLGLAFDPDYAVNGSFYVDYNANSGANTVARYTVSADANVADPASGVILKTIPHGISNHNGGCIQFGPDGHLYVSQGDAGNSTNAQNPATLLGKMLRLDVDNPPDYVPAANPFVGPGDPLDEIWALGLRNPFRFSFDRLTGDLFIGDVGAGAREEINYTPSGSTGAENYGWRCYEGNNEYNLAGCLSASNYQFPIHDYPHGSANGGCAVMSGYVYRGSAVCWLKGTYFFADYCYGKIWSFRIVDGVPKEFTQRNAQLAPGGGLSIGSISTFGEDANGELYIADRNGGEVFKIIPSTALMSIAAADPANDSLDVREDLSAGEPSGLNQFDVMLSSTNGGYCPADVMVDCNGGAPCPTVTGVTSHGGGMHTIALSGPIPPGFCTRFTFAYTAPGPSNPLVYRFLPGDVDASGTANTQDVLALIAAMSGGTTTPADDDIDRDGAVNTQDLLRLIQLLNGTETTQVWNGAEIVCP